MYKEQNSKYVRSIILSSWKPSILSHVDLFAVLFATLVTICVVVPAYLFPEFVANNPILFAVPGTLVATIFILVRKKQIANAVLREFQHPTPERAINTALKPLTRLKQIPGMQAMLGSESAIICAMYGDADKAKEALEHVNWSNAAPYVQATALNAHAYIQLLCFSNASAALSLVSDAQTRMALPSLAPGGATAKATQELNLAIVQAACGMNCDHNRLKKIANSNQQPIRAMLAKMGLALHFDRLGQAIESAAIRDELRRIAPFCAPLTRSLASYQSASQSTFIDPDSIIASLPQNAINPPQKRSIPTSILLWFALIIAFLGLHYFLVPTPQP